MQEKVERVRTEALTGVVPDEPEESDADAGDPPRQRLPGGTPPSEPAGTRYAGGRRLRTY